MSDSKYYDVGTMLAANASIKEKLNNILIDLHNIEQSVADNEITGNQIITAISSISLDIDEAMQELIVEDDA